MYTHLHVHSSASDGLATPEQLVAEAKRLGYRALALTDHNTINGHNEFVLACAQAGITPIYGVEVRLSTRFGAGHALILGVQPPWTTASSSYRIMRQMLGDPYRMSLMDLRTTDLTVTSACLGGEVAGALRRGDYHLARDIAKHFHEVLGERYYLEVQPSFGGLLPMVVALAHDLGIPVIGTNDVHYLSNSDALAAEPTTTSRMNLDLASEEQLRRRNALSSWQYAMDGAARLAEQLVGVPAHV